MRWVYYVMLVSGLLWLLMLAAVGWADQWHRREHLHRLETRDWQEKVEAMRRLQDIEGDA